MNIAWSRDADDIFGTHTFTWGFDQDEKSMGQMIGQLHTAWT